MKKWKKCCAKGAVWPTGYDGARVAAGLPQAAERRRSSLHANWFHGEQRLGNSAHDPRHRLRRSSASFTDRTLAAAFGGEYFLDEATIRAAYQPPHQFNAIHVPSALKIEFLMLRPVPFEREMFSRKLRHEILGQAAWIATPEDVILHKVYWTQITPSDRQLQDAAGVIAVQRGKLDEAYLRRWAAELGLGDTLEDLLSGRIQPKRT